MRSVALLRGINVGPTTKVPMAILRSLFEAAGATDVVTVLNSGNVVFSGSVDAPLLLEAIRSATGVNTHLIIVSGEQLRRIAAAFPYDGDESRLVVAFMPTVPAVELPDVSPELISLGDEAVYQSLPDGISNTKLTPAFWKQ
ncbi:MAG: DUF1697 domain-containing protein, partial [Salinibacterium sp.]|nr:DUF1697 domain-containing protein [Salinibacterium sp.]